MGLFKRNRKNPQAPHSQETQLLEELRQKLEQAQEEIAFLRSQNQRITQEAAPALKENAVLRYELFKCQSDRQVLEFHLAGLRAELGGTLALLSRLAPGEPPKGEPLLGAFLDLMEVGRRLGVEVQPLAEVEEAAKALLAERQVFSPQRFLRLRLMGILAALERLLSEEVQRAEHPADALAAFPEPLERLRQQLAETLATWTEKE